MEKFKFEFPTLEREKDVLEYFEELSSHDSELHAVSSLNEYLNNYTSWVEKLQKDIGGNPEKDRVPAVTYFLVRDTDNKLVGMINIRLKLNHTPWNFGGHIGYNVRPSERRKGYNKINLYLGLYVLNEYGAEVALLDCDKENLGSSATMRALGGKMIYEYLDPERNYVIQKYVIDIKDSLAKYKNNYSDIIAEYPGRLTV